MQVNPVMWFTQLVALLQHDGNIVEKCLHELTQEPISLFRHGMMRKPSKSVLRNYLLAKLPSLDRATPRSCVVDGGVLLSTDQWSASGTYDDVVTRFINFVEKRYGQS